MRSIRYTFTTANGRRMKSSALVKETAVETYLRFLRRDKAGFTLIEIVEV